MSKEEHLINLREVRDGIPCGLYEKDDRDNLYCVVVSHAIDSHLKTINVLHRRVSDNYNALWSLEASEFLHLYSPVKETEEIKEKFSHARKFCLNPKVLDTLPTYLLKGVIWDKEENGSHCFTFPTMHSAARFIAYSEEHHIQI